MKITTITGPMFAGKSTLLLKKIREAKRVPSFHVLAFKPAIDNRYDEQYIVTHDKDVADCITVQSPEEIWDHYLDAVLRPPYDKRIIVFIDEVQFFDQEIMDIVQKLVNDGTEVICAGLNLDRFGQPFGYMPQIMAISDEIILLKGKCKCGNDSYISYGAVDSEEQIVVGAEQYEPLCRSCWLERSKRNRKKAEGEVAISKLF